MKPGGPDVPLKRPDARTVRHIRGGVVTVCSACLKDSNGIQHAGETTMSEIGCMMNMNSAANIMLQVICVSFQGFSGLASWLIAAGEISYMASSFSGRLHSPALIAQVTVQCQPWGGAWE